MLLAMTFLPISTQRWGGGVPRNENNDDNERDVQDQIIRE